MHPFEVIWEQCYKCSLLQCPQLWFERFGAVVFLPSFFSLAVSELWCFSPRVVSCSASISMRMDDHLLSMAHLERLLLDVLYNIVKTFGGCWVKQFSLWSFFSCASVIHLLSNIFLLLLASYVWA